MFSLNFSLNASKLNKIIKTSKENNNTIEYYNDPTELLNELEIIIGSLKSGKTNEPDISK